MGYNTFLEQVSSSIDVDGMGLWQRQMNLGPGPEFCLHSGNPVRIPEAFSPVSIGIRRVWSSLV
jgi:hypothetical protein